VTDAVRPDPAPILLTGLPRGGTTLTVQLLGALADVVALDEPLAIREVFARRDGAAIRSHIADFAAATLDEVRAHGTARSKQLDGRVVDNHANATDPETGLSYFSGGLGRIRVENLTGGPLQLVLKHPFQFTACLDLLVPHFPVWAMLRNPLSVLASWNRVRFPIRQAQNPSAAVLAPELAARLEAEPDRIARQIRYLDWFFGQYLTHLPPDRLLRYEDMIASGGASLAPVLPAAAGLDRDLQSRNANTAYDRALIGQIGARLLGSDLRLWQVYSRDSVAGLLQRMGAG
jgi:hypothetical protein